MNKAHEKLLFRYSSALERGDFQAVADVLREAERDPLLEQMILDVNEAYAAETPGRFNHTNPKEVPMIAPLYQRRAPAPVRWHSLPLIAALAVIAVLTVLLANQIRGSMLATNGNGDQPPVLAQAQPLCAGVTRSPVDVHSRALSASAIIGALASSAPVTVYDQESITSGGAAEGWYFITAEGVAGWVPAQALDAAACQSQQMIILSSPTPTAYLMAEIVPTATVIPAQAACSPSLGARLLPVTLASRPGRDAQIVAEATSIDPHAVALLDSTTIAGETWYYVRIEAPSVNQQGWMTADSYNTNVTCALINRGEQPTLIPPLFQSVDSVPQPTLPQEVIADDLQPTVVPLLAEAFPATPQYYDYIVQPGDTLLSILRQFRLDYPSALADVQRMNNLSDGNLIPGSTLYLPPETASQPVCFFRTNHPTDIHASAGDSAPVIAVVPAGVDLLVLDTDATMNGLWVEITGKVDDVSISNAWVASSDLGDGLICSVPQSVSTPTPSLMIPDNFPPTMIPSLSLQPTRPPLIETASGELAPTLAPPATGDFPATPQYYVYVVQPGDTLLSILQRFHLDPSALPDVMRVNNLTEDSLVAPGITLYVPASQQLISLACRITAAQPIDLLVRPASGATVIGMIPSGADFELTDRSQQPDGVWYAVSLQVEGVTVTGGWLRPGTVAIPLDCQHAVPSTVITLVPSQEATAASPETSATPTAAWSSGALDSCVFDTMNAVTLHAQPSADSPAVELLHSGTPLQIWMLTDEWYSAQERYPDGPGNSGYVRVDTLTLPDDCHLSPAMVAATMPPLPVQTATQLPTPTLAQ